MIRLVAKQVFSTKSDSWSHPAKKSDYFLLCDCPLAKPTWQVAGNAYLVYLLPALGFVQSAAMEVPINKFFRVENDFDFASILFVPNSWISGTFSLVEYAKPVLARVWNDDGVFDDEDVWK